MQESTRRQYLALLGVDLWLPRNEADAVDDVSAVLPDAIPAAARAVAPTPESAVTPVATPTPEAELPVAPVEPPRAAPPAGHPTPAPNPPAVAAPPVVIAPPSAAAVPGEPERIGCSLLALPDGLLVIAAYIKPDAPGLAGPEYALLASIAAALAPAANLPSADDFRWPPPGVQLPEVLRPGAGSEALIGLLAEQRRKLKLRDVLLLGEAAAAPVSAACTRLGLNLVITASLAAMLADPAHKRACWDSAKVLRRS